MTTNVIAKSVTFLHETNHGCGLSHVQLLNSYCFKTMIFPTVCNQWLGYNKNHWYHTAWNVGQKQLTTFHDL